MSILYVADTHKNIEILLMQIPMVRLLLGTIHYRYLGRGGMAQVYKVWDKQRTTHLALKLLHEDLGEDKVFLRRFKREADTLSRLSHPNIVQFYGLEQEDYKVFMLMDYIEGSTLRRKIFRKERPYSAVEVRRIIQPLCSALNYAHNLGLIHCDIKPGNVMINDFNQVLLADFGISRFADGLLQLW